MKPKFVLLGIVLCVLSSAPLKANPDGSDPTTISGTDELSRTSIPEPGLLTLLTVGVLTLIAREKVRLDREHKNKRNARMKAYWQALKREPAEQKIKLEQEKQLNGHKAKYRPLVEVPPELLPQDTKRKPAAKGSQPEKEGFLFKR